MKAFFQKIELLWRKPFTMLLFKYRFGMVMVGLVMNIIFLFRSIISETVYHSAKALFTNAPFLPDISFGFINDVTDYHFYIPAILVLFAGYITGNIFGWIAYDNNEKISEGARKNSFIERLLSASPVGALMTDADGVVHYTNSEAHQILSTDENTPIIGRRLTDLDLIANTVLFDTVKKLQESYAGVFNNSIAFKKGPNSPIQWFRCTFSPVTQDNDRIGCIGWIHDVTDQKKKQEDVINSIILALTKAIDAKDKGTHAHSMRVRNISLTLARYINLPAENFPNLEYASLLHDIGKILLPDDVIRGNTSLTPEQKAMIFRLPEYSASFLDDIDDLSEVRDIVYYQKEWFVPPKDKDTKFKPFPGIKTGENIPVEARVLAVADAYEGMTTEKGYRKKMPKDIAVIEFKRSSGIKPTEDEINRLLSHYKQERQNDIGLDELLSHSRLERQFDFKIVRALEKAISDNKL